MEKYIERTPVLKLPMMINFFFFKLKIKKSFTLSNRRYIIQWPIKDFNNLIKNLNILAQYPGKSDHSY